MSVFLQFPPNLLYENTVDWNIIGALASAGQTDSGILQPVRLDGGGYWQAKLNDIQAFDDSQARTFRALRIIADNGSVTIIVPRHDVFQPWPVSGGTQITSYGTISHSDGSLFSDGAGYGQNVIDITCAGDAALRATRMNIAINYGSTLQGGESFSIEHDAVSHHLYEIATIAENADGTFDISFRPPLREAISYGAKLDFDLPKCCMRLAAQDSMAYKLGTFPYLPQTATFIESNVSSGS